MTAALTSHRLTPIPTAKLGYEAYGCALILSFTCTVAASIRAIATSKMATLLPQPLVRPRGAKAPGLS